MPQFDVATFASQIFWLILCFGFLCLIMVRLLVPRLTSALEAREQRLQEDKDRALTLNREAAALKEKNLARLAEARDKAHFLVNQAFQEVHQIKANRIATLEAELVIKTKAFRQDLEAQTQKIRSNLTPLVFQIFTTVTPRILGQPIDKAEANGIIQDILKKQGHS